ncbi:hypothetical protein [Streptomyces sp. NRRL F-5123]|uniref:hypothetical protein n=1 Tax=Streptomyces sp. NRRL F-5123 TaxID=1463856 RepID=UPI0004E155D7|nr:hypothetical protein [Streptomyces sp. NRRL F-5123]
MTVLRFRFFRVDTVVSATGESFTEQVEVRPPITYDSDNPLPGTAVKIVGFPQCRCPRAPACNAREKKARGSSSARAPPVRPAGVLPSASPA